MVLRRGHGRLRATAVFWGLSACRATRNERLLPLCTQRAQAGADNLWVVKQAQGSRSSDACVVDEAATALAYRCAAPLPCRSRPCWRGSCLACAASSSLLGAPRHDPKSLSLHARLLGSGSQQNQQLSEASSPQTRSLPQRAVRVSSGQAGHGVTL